MTWHLSTIEARGIARANSPHSVDAFLHSELPRPALPSPITASSSRSASPVIPTNGRRSPYQPPSRSATSPLPVSVPSRDLSISQDCAFPPFPTSKSRSATPTTPSESSFPLPNRYKPQAVVQGEAAQMPLNSRGAAGGNIMRSVNSDVRSPSSLLENSRSPGYGHGKTPSMSNSQNHTRPPSSENSKSHFRQPSTSSSVYTRNPSISSTSGSARFTFERHQTEVPAVPVVPQQPDVNMKDASHTAGTPSHSKEAAFDFGSFGKENRSQTFPKHDNSQRSDEQASFHRRPSEPSVRSHRPRPSVAAAVMQPLHEIGSTSSFKPSKSIRGRNAAPSSNRTMQSSIGGNYEGKDDRIIENAPPVPIPFNSNDGPLGDSYHTPHESVSSDGSYSSGVKTGSSRSSPPLNESPLRSAAHPIEDTRINDLFTGFHFDVSRRPSFEELSESSEKPSSLDSRTRLPEISAFSQPTIPPLSTYHEAPSRTLTPIHPADDSMSSLAPPPENYRVSPATLAPPSTQDPPARRPRTANKGNCRGCGELIKGKSVSSADGRLTGHYHKQCLVCKTCQAPFLTADFYVMHNNPYCSRHYHELNGSLCNKCDRGIEGQYLETEVQKKFHPHCFSCQECHRILRDDYFEWNGRTLCEQHAFRAAQQPSSLGPGRRYPERRTTRLMMM